MSGKAVAITSTVGTTVVSWFTSASQNNCNAAFASNIGGIGTANSLYTGSGSTACLTTTAGGAFQTTVTVPAMPGGAQTIAVTDGTNTVDASFNITPSLTFSVTSGDSNFGFPQEGVPGTFDCTGFGASESVTISAPVFSTTVSPCTTNTMGSGTTSNTYTIADTSGGSKTMSATGATSGLTATTTFTVNPWAAFYSSGNGHTSFGFLGTAPTSLIVEAHGLPAGTISANSITIGGVTASNPAISVGTSGAIYNVVVAPSTNVPFGPVNVVIDGTTFSYSAGNIATTTGVSSGIVAHPGSASPWGGALVSSILCPSTCSSGTAVVKSDATSYMPGSVTTQSSTSPAPQQNSIAFFGYGFASGTTVSITAPSGASLTGGLSPSADANGAMFTVTSLGNTPWSTAANPSVAAQYTPTFAQALGPNSILGPSFSITPWIDTTFGAIQSGSAVPTVSATTTSGLTFQAHGFGATDTLTATIGGSAISSGATCTASTGACTISPTAVPDLASGSQSVTVTGSVSGQTGTASVTYETVATFSGTSTALSIVSGPSGSTTILRTSTGSSIFGVHGLAANTGYSIVWNGMGSTQVLGTFTSTATGGIPVPGVQITLPADVAGIHIIDIQKTSSLGTSALFGQTTGDLQLSDSTDTTGLGSTYTSNYGDLLFSLGTSLIASPTVANVGQSVAISGNGLSDNTQYDLGVSMAGDGSGSTPSTCALTGTNPANAPTVIVGSFTTTAAGAVPSGTTLALTDMPTVSGHEQGTLYCAFAQLGADFGTTTAVGTAQFLLAASATVNMTGAAIGHSIVLNAHALAANTGYNIIFAPYTNPGTTTITGTVVGAILSNQNGAGFATFSVPSNIQTASGSQPVVNGQSYTVELQASGSTSTALASPPSVTAGASSGPGVCNTTSCMTVSGTPSVTTKGAYNGISSTFINTSNAPETAFVYAVVHNALGQTVAISTATVSAPAGGSVSAFNVLFGLPPASYTVSIFVVSSSGTAISLSTPVTVTIA